MAITDEDMAQQHDELFEALCEVASNNRAAVVLAAAMNLVSLTARVCGYSVEEAVDLLRQAEGWKRGTARLAVPGDA